MADTKFQGLAFRRATLGESAYKTIRNAIVSLQLQPGEMVYEAELSASLGISRTPVREAFRLLLAEELIEILPQRGIRIAYISKKKVEEAWFVRESLELSAFRIVAKAWNSAEDRFRMAEENLGKILDEQKLEHKNNNFHGFVDSDEAFHRVILEQADNSTLLAMISIARAHLNRVRYLELEKMHHFDSIIKQHEAIFAAIRGNHEEETVDLLKRHLDFLRYDFPSLINTYASFFRD